MTCNESDDILEKQREINDLKRQIEHIDQEVASLAYRRKFLKHRLNDLEYEVRMSSD